MNSLHYVGLDVHKKSVSYCVKTAAGAIIEQGKVAAQRAALERWAREVPGPWYGAMEATLFSGWIYDVLQPYTQQLQMANPRELDAITHAKKKSDAIDAANWRTCCVAICCPLAMWPRRGYASCADCASAV
jgi:hypothetical protein